MPSVAGKEGVHINYRGFVLENNNNSGQWVAWLSVEPGRKEHWFKGASLTDLKKQIDNHCK